MKKPIYVVNDNEDLRGLSEEEVRQGFFTRNGQKTTIGIERICEESAHASLQTLMNQYF